MIKTYLKNNLNAQSTFFIIWCVLASFGAYFSMYAFRKPLSAATFDGIEIFGYGAKTLFITAQVLGYMFSKFLGIKIISELKSNQRILAGSIIIAIAYVSLFLFALLPVNYKVYTLFLNGLPLGMVWGVVFSFMEGRRVTELISSGLAISIIFSSGILKFLSRLFIDSSIVNEFWMPFIMASIFLPFFLFFLWMLSVIPKPSDEDINLRHLREPMTEADRIKIIQQYGIGILLLILIYVTLTICRDLRDNYAVEVWKQIGITNSNIYYISEAPVALFAIVLLASLIRVKNNLSAFNLSIISVILGIGLIGIFTILYFLGFSSPLVWMIMFGVGIYFAYIPFHCILFERFFAASKSKGNVGFLMYLCDSFGYMGSIFIMLYKEFFFKNQNWLLFLKNISIGVFLFGIPITIYILYYFNKKFKIKNL